MMELSQEQQQIQDKLQDITLSSSTASINNSSSNDGGVAQDNNRGRSGIRIYSQNENSHDSPPSPSLAPTTTTTNNQDDRSQINKSTELFQSNNTNNYNNNNNEPLLPPIPSVPVRGQLLYKANRMRKMTTSLPSGHRASTWNGFNHLKSKQLQMDIPPKPNTKEKRTNILKEILSTEQAYVSFLTVLIDVYLAKMREKEVMNNDEIGLIFSNIEAIKSANEEILSRLKERIEVLNQPPPPPAPSLSPSPPIEQTDELSSSTTSPTVQQNKDTNTTNNNNNNSNNNNNNTNNTNDKVGEESETPEEVVIISDIFIEFGPFLKIYSIFVNNYYNNAMKVIKGASRSKKFKAYHNECKYTPFARKLELNDLMIMPVQRLPRYILLLDELIQYTPTKTVNNEKENLQNARAIMKEVVSYVNQSTEQDHQEPQQQLAIIQQQLGPKAGNLIQPHRSLVKFGDLDRLVINSDGAPKKRKIGVYLFNDIIIYAVNKKFWRQLSLSEVWIRTRNIEDCETFEIYSQELSCIFLVDSDTLHWPLLIQDTINTYLDNNNDAKETRKKILEDLQDRSDITFEEKQFFFESVSNIGNNGSGGDDKNSKTIIEKGIVSDRKKKLEHLLLERRNILSDNEDMMMMEDHSSLSDIDHRPSSPPSSPSIMGDANQQPNKKSSSKKKKKNGNGQGNDGGESNDTGKPTRKHPSAGSLIRSTSTKMLFNSPSNANRLLHIVLMRNNIKREGYLTKIGGVVKSWKRRWFIMENGYLFYLKDRNDTQQLGTIALIGSSIDSISIEGKSFNIVTKHRTFMLMGDTEEDIREWTGAIQQFYDERQATILKYANQLTSSAKDFFERGNGGRQPDGWLSASPLSRSASTISLHNSMDDQVQKRLASFRNSSSKNSDINRSTESFCSEISTSPPSPKWRMTTGNIPSNRKEFIGMHSNYHIDTDEDDEEDDDSFEDDLYHHNHQNLGDDDDVDEDDDDDDDEFSSESSSEDDSEYQE